MRLMLFSFNKKVVIIVLFSFVFFGFSPKKEVSNWELKKSENGISVYTRLTKDSEYKELKATFQIKTSLSSIIALLNDVESYPQWVYRCQTSKVLKKDSDQHLIRYQTIVAPWPVDNRDVVVEVNTRQDEKTNVVYQKVSALPSYSPKLKGHVRITQFRALWTLTPLKNGFVLVEYELLVNPAGSIPAWLVNLAMVEGPFDTSVKMRDRLMMEKYQKASFEFITNPK